MNGNMEYTMKIFNADFGLNQLNQNRELLCRLLNKFVDDYHSAPSDLLNMIENQQWDSAVLTIHTIKGISGNLGLEQLYEMTNTFEMEAKAQQLSPVHLEQMTRIITETITDIKHFIQSDDAPKTADSVPADATDNL